MVTSSNVDQDLALCGEQKTLATLDTEASATGLESPGHPRPLNTLKLGRALFCDREGGDQRQN